MPGSPSESRAPGPGEPEPPRKVSRALPPSRFQGISAGIREQDFTELLLTPTPCLEGTYWVVTMLSCEIQSPQTTQGTAPAAAHSISAPRAG